jgi:multiple antibiotic resistance protein
MLDFFKTIFFLIAVIDPLGSIPVYLEATKQFSVRAKRRIAVKATGIALGVLLFFILVGQYIMEGMHISMEAFQISGGVILFLFSLTMVFGEGKPEEEKHMIKDYSHVTVFPIAIPSIASPGAIMAVVLLTDNDVYKFWQQAAICFAVVIVLIFTCILLLMAGRIQERVGETGITVISKIMGLILASFAIQSILTGIKDYFHI